MKGDRMKLRILDPEQRARLHRKAELWIKLHPNQSSCENPICIPQPLCRKNALIIEDLTKAGYWFHDLQSCCFVWMKGANDDK